jgi:hypothetical protein
MEKICHHDGLKHLLTLRRVELLALYRIEAVERVNELAALM